MQYSTIWRFTDIPKILFFNELQVDWLLRRHQFGSMDTARHWLKIKSPTFAWNIFCWLWVIDLWCSWEFDFIWLTFSDEVWQNIKWWVSISSQSVYVIPIIICCYFPSAFTRASAPPDPFVDFLSNSKTFETLYRLKRPFQICTWTDQYMLPS